MRLLSLNQRGDLDWAEFSQDKIPPYAILSHTWGTEEVSFLDLINGDAKHKAGYRKVVFCGKQATRDGLHYFWVDSCSIDKRSSAELATAINSMFRWYRNAVKCYVYLSDVSTSAVGVNAENCQSAWETDFRKSRWFRRGWTLQELLAPAYVEFYSAQHQRLGSKESLCPIICDITSIPVEALSGRPLNTYSIKERLTWAIGRQTTEGEDEAYCLLGIFDIFMPLIYGEGKDNALNRLHAMLDGHPIRAMAHNATSGNERLEVEACLRSLGFSNLKARQNDIADVLPGTCDWFFETDEFCRWRDRVDLSTNNGVLWLKGKPGAGKSTLMKHVFNYCKDRFDSQLIVSYFFNDRGDQLEKTYIGMLRSIVYQLIQGDDGVQGRFIQRFREREMTYEAKSLEWLLSDLRNIVASELGRQITRPVVLLIDALDECRESDVGCVVEFLENLSIKASSSGTTIRICLSSRHYPSIDMNRKLELILENKKEHQEDIASYIRQKLGSKDEKLYGELERKANGVFLWAILVVAILNKAFHAGRIEEMEEKLDSLPGDLEVVFNTMLGKDERHKAETVLMLQFVLFSETPLTPTELFFGVITEVAPQFAGPWDRTRITSESIERRIIDSSKGLIEIRKGGVKPQVQFIHRSVNDFLHRSQRLSRLDPTLAPDTVRASHKRLWSCCWKYMAQFDMTQTTEDSDQIEMDYPFLLYALSFVVDFGNKALPLGEAKIRWRAMSWLVSWFQGQTSHIAMDDDVSRWFREHDKWFTWWKQILKPSRRRNTDLDIEPDVELLYISVSNGWREVVRLLLDAGADVNAQGGFYGNALKAAAFRGSQEVTQLLLDAGADVNAQGGHYGNALQAAAYQGSRKITQLLFDAKADVNAQGGHYGNALQAAAFRGSREVIQLLLDAGADVNAQGGHYGNALQTAVSQGSREVTQLLLDARADVNAQGGHYGNALQVAAAWGSREVIQLLLDAGADVNAQGGHYGNALQVASYRGSRKITQLLLEAGADVNAQGGHYGNALQAASYRESREVTQLLLEAGADVNAQGGHYGNALRAALSESSYAVVDI